MESWQSGHTTRVAFDRPHDRIRAAVSRQTEFLVSSDFLVQFGKAITSILNVKYDTREGLPEELAVLFVACTDVFVPMIIRMAFERVKERSMDVWRSPEATKAAIHSALASKMRQALDVNEQACARDLFTSESFEEACNLVLSDISELVRPGVVKTESAFGSDGTLATNLSDLSVDPTTQLNLYSGLAILVRGAFASVIQDTPYRDVLMTGLRDAYVKFLPELMGALRAPATATATATATAPVTRLTPRVLEASEDAVASPLGLGTLFLKGGGVPGVFDRPVETMGPFKREVELDGPGAASGIACMPKATLVAMLLSMITTANDMVVFHFARSCDSV